MPSYLFLVLHALVVDLLPMSAMLLEICLRGFCEFLELKILKLLIRTAEDRLRIPWPGGAIHMPLDKVRTVSLPYFLTGNSNF